MALYRAIQGGAKPAYLFTIMREDGKRSRSHGIKTAVLEQQATALGIPLITRSATWDDYEEVFIKTLKEMKDMGIGMAVFGDIDFEENRAWEEMVCQEAGLEAYLPIWQKPRRELLESFVRSWFHALIVSCHDEKIGNRFLGNLLTLDLIEKFEQMGIDPAGEKGEYHTLVIDGPIFDAPMRINLGVMELFSGYWFLEVSV